MRDQDACFDQCHLAKMPAIHLVLYVLYCRSSEAAQQGSELVCAVCQ
jgi:hypothetical protein